MQKLIICAINQINPCTQGATILKLFLEMCTELCTQAQITIQKKNTEKLAAKQLTSAYILVINPTKSVQ